LHAGSLDEAFHIVCGENRVPDDHAALIDLFVYIRSLGPWQQPARRVVAAVHELTGVSSGRPAGRLLHRWDESTDTFEAVDPAVRIGAFAGSFEQRLAEFTAAT
jgi:hypothetical protein